MRQNSLPDRSLKANERKVSSSERYTHDVILHSTGYWMGKKPHLQQGEVLDDNRWDK